MVRWINWFEPPHEEFGEKHSFFISLLVDRQFSLSLPAISDCGGDCFKCGRQIVRGKPRDQTAHTIRSVESKH